MGVAGPFAGVHNDALIIAGGANFPRPVWQNDKVWRDRIFVLVRAGDGYRWKDGGKLPGPSAYGAAVSTPDGVVCMGGNHGTRVLRDVFLLSWDSARGEIRRSEYPPLPRPCAYGQATLVDGIIYLAGGQQGNDLTTAMQNFWALDLSKRHVPDAFVWRELAPWPGPSRALGITATQHNGYNDCVYVMSGRRQEGDEVQFLKDVWEFTPASSAWRRRADSPRSIMAGLGIGCGQSHILILGGADGSFFFKGDELKDKHPGFPQEALAYHTITDTWTSAGPIPGSSHVTTIPVLWDGMIVIPSGEVRPRVRSPVIWGVRPVPQGHKFGAINYVVLFGYLLAMVGVGSISRRRTRIPTIATDQIFPQFIATEMPVGLAGLIVAGIFAAAQSTVSTSMNSTATAIVTDFLRPLNACKSETSYLNAARSLTLLMGVLGTLFGLIFVNPEIKSLFDAFLKVIGLFMGVLGGLFVLGVMTRRANAKGALCGALIGAGVMFYLWAWTQVNGYIYTAAGIGTCFVTGYLASLLLPGGATLQPVAIEAWVDTGFTGDLVLPQPTIDALALRGSRLWVFV